MKPQTKAVCVVLALIMVAGFACWVCQQIWGLGITGMSNGVSWGLYICLFLLFVGLSAGGLIVASAGSVFHIEDYERVALPAVITSLSCIVVAGALVLVDLGGIARFWRLFTGPNPNSPLIWDITVITTYMVLNILELVFLVSDKPGSDHRVVVVSRIALPVAILVHSVTAWILGLQIGRDWYSSIMAPLFVVSALDSGLGLLILVLLGLRKNGVFVTPDRIVSKLALLLAVVVALDGYFVGTEVLSSWYPQEEHVLMTLGEMFTGATAPAFWGEIICLLAAFLILVFKRNRANMAKVATASALVVVSVLCKRIWLLFSSFIHPNIDYGPGIISGSLDARLSSGDAVWSTVGQFVPTLPEVMVSLAVIAFGALLFIALTHALVPKYRRAHADAVDELESEARSE